MQLPTSAAKPRHVAIIMDGNGRWAHSHGLERAAGHRQGLLAAHETVTACLDIGIENLTLFAFSTDNWRRPRAEVNVLLELFAEGLRDFLPDFLKHGVCVRFIGDPSRFPRPLRIALDAFARVTSDCECLHLQVALNYSGRWDVTEAVRQLADAGMDLGEVTEADITSRLATAGAPVPDLLIRTSGELRLSNFMLWQTAYTELYFTEVLWPDFDAAELRLALNAFAQRERRFGMVSQVQAV